MRISVVGCGYLGAVHAAAMAEIGHDVVGVDVDSSRVEALSQGRPPFHEPGFADLLSRALSSSRLRFTDCVADAAGADLHFLCVGTPQSAADGSADLSSLHSAVRDLTPHLTPSDAGPAVVVGKSTVPVGTAEVLAAELAQIPGAPVLAWNPEFLREGNAVRDSLAPDRIVYGLPADPERAVYAADRLSAVYAPIVDAGAPVLPMDYATAELVKVAANSFLATKVSFINAMAELCEATGADVTLLADAIGRDDRIGAKFLRAGVGFGGGCLPKDIRAFMARAEQLGADQSLGFLREVDSINARRRDHAVELARKVCGGDLDGRRVAVLGAAFKPHSDDVRDSPALDIATRLDALGARVAITDPAAGPRIGAGWPSLRVAHDAADAVRDAELVMLLTEWPEFVQLDPASLVGLVAQPRIIDGRNALDPGRWRAAGWEYVGLGRP